MILCRKNVETDSLPPPLLSFTLASRIKSLRPLAFSDTLLLLVPIPPSPSPPIEEKQQTVKRYGPKFTDRPLLNVGVLSKLSRPPVPPVRLSVWAIIIRRLATMRYCLCSPRPRPKEKNNVTWRSSIGGDA